MPYNGSETEIMSKSETEKLISQKAAKFLSSLPVKIRKTLLLTGGGAAFLYGSDRPFSNDIDFMVPKESIPTIEKVLKATFEYRRKKPVFHSLVCSAETDGTSFDLVAESIIQPDPKGPEYAFRLNQPIIKKSVVFKIGQKSIACVPKELLVAIKLMAGRGRELGKYDLYDLSRILEKNPDFDFGFFGAIVSDFCAPLKSSLPLLVKNAKKAQIGNPGNEAIGALLDSLRSLR